MLPYAIEAGPAMDRILRDVYGIESLQSAAGGAQQRGGAAGSQPAVLVGVFRVRWQQIGREYGVKQVLTPARWKLDLPLVASSDEFELYEIPR